MAIALPVRSAQQGLDLLVEGIEVERLGQMESLLIGGIERTLK
ncbi:hypothetical protein ACIPW4_05240 [Pseudomonas sp. NPDC089996]